MSRFYSFRIVTYYTEEKNIQRLLQQAYKYAWILHDKDDTDPHIHILATFKQNKSFETVRKMIIDDSDNPQNTFVQEMKNRYEDFAYLPHAEGYDKAIYDENDIHCNDLPFFTGQKADKTIENAEFINDLCDKSMTHRAMAIKYGRDYMKNYSAYRSFIELMIKQEELLFIEEIANDIEVNERGRQMREELAVHEKKSLLRRIKKAVQLPIDE